MLRIWQLFLYIQHKVKAHEKVNGLHLHHSPWFSFKKKKKGKNLCLLTSTCMAACLILCVCVSIHECVRGQKWRCYPVVIHHTRDTRSPALLYTEAMFYKRITRQRAPSGHPLPPRATCKDVHGLPLQGEPWGRIMLQELFAPTPDQHF